MKIKNSYFQYITVLISVVSLGLFLLISTERWQLHDDWLFIVRLNKMGLVPWAWEYYKTWDARFIFPVFLSYWAIIKIVGFKWVMILLSAVYIIISYLILRILELRRGFKLSNLNRIIGTAILVFGTWFATREMIKDTLYWMTAGVYFWALLFCVVWLYLFIKNEYYKSKPGISFYLLSFFVFTSAQNISIGVFAFMVLISFVHKLKSGVFRLSKSDWILIVLGIIGVGVSTISPGSMAQFNGEIVSDYGNKNVGGIKNFIIHFIALYKDAFTFFGITFYAVIVFVGILIGLLVYSNGYKISLFSGNSYLSIKEKVLELIQKHVFLIAAVFCLFIYWPTPLLAPRYYIGFYFFMYLYIIDGLLAACKPNNSSTTKSNLNLYILVTLVLLGSVQVYKNSYSNSKLMNDFRRERDYQIELCKNSNTRINVPYFSDNFAPTLVKSEELSTDSTYIYNLILKDLYKVPNLGVSKAIDWNELNSNRNRVKELIKENTQKISK